jgi:hypothetical protein
MADTSRILSLPLLQPAQAQKHVTHNEALRRLDALVQLVVADRDLSEAPVLPEPGDRHIVAPDPLGLWAGRAGQIALWEVTGWEFIAPLPGWQAFVRAEARAVVWTGTEWAALAHLAPQVDMLGINTAADATNRLAVASPATLFTHAGAGHQLKLNKATPTDTASLLFQTGWSGRAEMGLAGDDGFAIKVSADGAGFATAVQADPASAAVSLPGGLLAPAGTEAAPGIRFAADPDTGLRHPGADQIGLVTGGVQRVLLGNGGLQLDVPLTGTAVTQGASDATPGRVLKVGDSATLLAASPALRTGSGGSANALALTSGAGITGTPPTGLYLRFRAAAANTGAVTIALDGGAALACRTITGVALPAGYIRTDAETEATFDGTFWVLDRQAEAVSTANGRCTRQADGTQTCAHSVNLPYVSSSTCQADWTFPAAFSSTAVAVVMTLKSRAAATPLPGELAAPRADPVTATAATLRQPSIMGLTAFAPGDVIAMHAFATGPWY